MKSIIATARIAFIDTVKRLGFWISSTCFIAAAAIASIPFSPGIAADPVHYMEAGLSTLLLGGVFISFAIVPLLLTSSGAGYLAHEGLLALPVGRNCFVIGVFIGYATALFWFFVIGGLILLRVSVSSNSGLAFADPLVGAFFSYLLSLVAAALVLLTSRFLPYAVAVAAALLILILGHVSNFLPFFISVFHNPKD